jgi:hypothetical protein
MTAAIRARGCGQSSFDTPAFTQSLTQGAVLYTERFRPFNQRHCSSIERNNGIAAAISVLFLNCSPTAIAWLIVAIIVGIAIERMAARRASSHVRQEVFEAEPIFAHANASTAIPPKFWMRWIQASFLHRGPSLIGRCFSSQSGMAMLCLSYAISAMAACHITSAHMGDRPLTLFSTETAHEHGVRIAVSSLRIPHEEKRTESSPGDDNFVSWHSGHAESLPNNGTGYGQRENKLADLRHTYTNAGGIVA